MSSLDTPTRSTQRLKPRDIVIETPEGDFELTLFSEYVSDDEDRNLLEVKV